MKRRTPLQVLWKSVQVQSRADNRLVVTPIMKDEYRRPGVLTRMYAARHLERVINAHLKRKERAK